ncbi:MAG: hypothetical protein IPP88_18150 [Betaproteobacteria bacterium]|nr:hypothetical protein [Betaproteobacteria bacterium]
MNLIEKYAFLIVGIVLLGVWAATIFILYRARKDASAQAEISWLDLLTVWPLLLRDHATRKTKASTVRIAAMLLVLVVGWVLLVRMGRYY